MYCGGDGVKTSREFYKRIPLGLCGVCLFVYREQVFGSNFGNAAETVFDPYIALAFMPT